MNIHGYVHWGTCLSPFILQGMSNYACLVSIVCIFRRFLFSMLWVVLILVFVFYFIEFLLDTIKFWLEHGLTCIVTTDFYNVVLELFELGCDGKGRCLWNFGKIFFKCSVCMGKLFSSIIFEYLYDYIFPKGSFGFFYGSYQLGPFLRKTKTWQLTVVRVLSDRGFFCNYSS